MRLKLIIYLLLISFTQTWAVSEDSIRTESVRKFDKERIEDYKKDSDFDYLTKDKSTDWFSGFLEWLAKWLAEVFEDWFKDKDPSVVIEIIGLIIRGILWGLFISALLIIGISLYKRGVFGVIRRKEKVIDLNFKELEENVLDTDWDQLIREAEQERRWNISVRLHFLKLLKSLNQSGVIVWDKSKTIRDYRRELPEAKEQGFFDLARYYQYAWFGEINIEEPQYQKMKLEFESFIGGTHVAKV